MKEFTYCEPDYREPKGKPVQDDCLPPREKKCDCKKKPKRPCRCGGTHFKEPTMKRINCCPWSLRRCKGTRCCCKCQKTCCDSHPCSCGA